MTTKIIALLLSGLLAGVQQAAAAPFFGYYHVWDDDLGEVADHVDMLWIQSANPRENADALLRSHPKAAFVFEFQPLGQAFVGGQKIMSFDAARVDAILDAVEAWIPPHRSRLYAFSIVDEIETNPPSLDALQRLVDAIKARPALASIPLHVNFDNISPMYTRTPFVIPDRLDLVSITPAYGQSMATGVDASRIRTVMDRVADYNARRPGQPLRWLAIGDGWAPQPADAIHEVKARALYATALRLARERGIDIAGQIVFSYSDPPGGVKDSPGLREVWRAIGRDFLSGSSNPSPCEPPPPPPPAPHPPFPPFPFPVGDSVSW